MGFDQFLQLLHASGVSTVVFQPDDLLEVFTTTKEHLTTRIIGGLSTEWVVQRLVEAKTSFSEGRRQPSSLARSLRGAFVIFMPLMYLYLAYRMLRKLTDDTSESMVDLRKRCQPRAATVPVTWDSVAGMDEARHELIEVVDCLRNPERYARVGARCPRGVLLHGPPGCGKTLLARAAAHEAGVNLIVCSASDFVEVFVGRGAARVRELFQRAERCAPCILFFDELDALAKSRTGGSFGNDEREQTLNQLLTEMDGFDSTPDGRLSESADTAGRIVVIAATNRPDVLDAALLRPGRFDRHVMVGFPNEDGRLAILRVHVKERGVPLEHGVSLRETASKTSGFSGADLSNVINEAALLAVRCGRDTVTSDDLSSATRKVSNMHEPNE